ncbi:DUF2785 domain-containing protein [Terricaulis sp.]|uniref:DUF2785 domain-containing protein n=1 Tax=Terricaulis sp. TaxID=2768686 RepID=UPI002AC7B5BC|nr:DUF2785 domain-containing protein [Terricaulis sp.]MDZ4692593.1 DUF2785 domain-containing protein [Terricaulis sp.]
MKRLAVAAALLALAACATAPALAQSACQPAGYSRAQLDALKAAEWALPDDTARNRLALALTSCLGSPDPTLRDGIAFEGLQHWLRARQLTPETMRMLAADLQTQLGAPDAQGFRQPFGALVLSEVARADRVEPYLDASTRTRLLDASLAYFTSVRDYRGFDAREGWRHGVAHGADLMLQLSLNPAFGKPELERILDAIAGQVAPDEHFYIYGESERLARPIIFMAQRGLISEEEWTRWFAHFPTAGENMFASQAGLARRHNVNAFLQTIWLNARLSESTADDVLLPGAEAAIRAMP